MTNYALLRMFSRMRIDAQPSNTIEDALNHLERIRFDVVFSDVRLGGGQSGLEFMEQVALRVKNELIQPVTIIAMSCIMAPHDVERCKMAGAHATLTKPFGSVDVLNLFAVLGLESSETHTG